MSLPEPPRNPAPARRAEAVSYLEAALELGLELRLPIPAVARVSGVSGDALRMRARRLGVELRREGRVVTVAWAELERLTTPATMPAQEVEAAPRQRPASRPTPPRRDRREAR